MEQPMPGMPSDLEWALDEQPLRSEEKGVLF